MFRSVGFDETWIPRKARDFAGQAVVLSAQLPDNGLKYLRNAAIRHVR